MRAPIVTLVRFWANHHLLDLVQRPVWRVVKGRSRSYVNAICAGAHAMPDWLFEVPRVNESAKDLACRRKEWLLKFCACLHSLAAAAGVSVQIGSSEIFPGDTGLVDALQSCATCGPAAASPRWSHWARAAPCGCAPRAARRRSLTPWCWQRTQTPPWRCSATPARRFASQPPYL